jgi:Ca2+-binding EF-hand superfamily protein
MSNAKLLTRWCLITLLCAASVWLSQQQQQQQQPPKRPPLQPLDKVLLLVLDKNKDSKVTRDEVGESMLMLELLLQMPPTPAEGSDNDNAAAAAGYSTLIQWLKTSSPIIFNVLDTNNDNILSPQELKVFVQFEQSLTKKGTGGLKELVRDIFAFMDMNNDDQLSNEEISTKIVGTLSSNINNKDDDKKEEEDNKEELLSTKIRNGLLSLFPTLRTDILDADIMPSIMSALTTYMDEATNTLDTDNNGYISRSEVGKYYNTVGKKIMEVSKMIKTMGPMIAMFGGGAAGGAAGGGGGFKMDL